MWRRSFTILALMGAGLAVVAAGSRSQDRASPAEDQKVLQAVVHINFLDSERQGHGLRNIENILKEAKDGRIEVVCHGAGITLLVKDRTKHAAKVEQLMKRGVRFAACENSMREKGISRDDLLRSVEPVPSGAADVIRKQQQGYAYLRP